jgi:hypothetical protein
MASGNRIFNIHRTKLIKMKLPKYPNEFIIMMSKSIAETKQYKKKL